MRGIIFFFLLAGLMNPVFSQLTMSKAISGWGLQNNQGEWIFKPENDTIMRFTINDSLGTVNTFYLGIKGELGTTLCDESNEFLNDPFFSGGDFLLTDSSGSLVYTINDLQVSFAFLGDLPYTRQISINKNPCYLRHELGVIYDRVYPSDFLVRKGNYYGIINHKPGLKTIVDLVYDTVIVNTYPVKYYSCRSKGKYDYYLGNGTKINDTPADTLYEFYLWTTGPDGDYEIDGRRLFCLLTGSKTTSVPLMEEIETFAYNPETGEEETYFLLSKVDLPKISGGSLKLFNEKFEVLDENVEDLALSYQFDRYEEQSSGPTDYIFHILSQNDTTNAVRKEDSFYRTPGKISPNSIGAVKKNGVWKVYNMTKYKAIPDLKFSGEHLQKIKKAGGTWAMRSDGKFCLVDTNGILLNDCDYDDISTFSQVNFGNDSVFLLGYIGQFKKNGKWGLTDDKGRIVVKPNYSGIVQTYHGTYLVNTNGKLKYLEHKESVPQHLIYDAINGAPPRLQSAAVREIKDSFFVGGKFGVLTNNGSELIPANYSCIIATDTGYLAFKGGKEIVRSIPFSVAYPKEDYNNLLYYEKPVGGTIIYFDLNGNKIKELDSYYTPTDYYYGKTNYFIREKNGKFGLSAQDYTEIIPPSYDLLRYLDHQGDEYFFLAERKNKKGIINEKGSVVVPLEYSFLTNYGGKFIATKNTAPREVVSLVESYEGTFSFSDYFFNEEKGLVIDTSGKFIMRDIDSLISRKSDGFGPESIDVYKNGKKGFLTSSGYVPPEYEVYQAKDAYKVFITINSNKYGAFSYRGLNLAPSADTAYYLDENLYYTMNGKTGILSVEGKEILKPEWKKIEWIDSPDYFFVVNGEKGTGIISEKGETLIPAINDSVDHSLSGYEAKIIKCWKGGLAEIYSLAAKRKLSETKFESFDVIYSVFIGKVNGKFGLYAQDVGEIVPPRYDKITWAAELDMYQLEADGKKQYLNEEMALDPAGEEKWKASMIYRFSKSSADKINSFKWESEDGPFGCDATAFMIDTDGTWCLGTGSSGGVFVSRDNGKTWTERNSGIGPVHVLDIKRIRDTVFITTAVSGKEGFVYATDSLYVDEWKWYKDVFCYNARADSWIKLDQTHADAVADTMRSLSSVEEEKNTQLFYIDSELNGELTGKEPVVVYRYDAKGDAKDTLHLRFPMDYITQGKAKMYKDKLYLLAQSGLYIIDFKTRKVDRSGMPGLLASDITKIYPYKNGEVFVVTGKNAAWKLKDGKWQNKYDAWRQFTEEKRIHNNIDLKTISWNKKGEGLFAAEGNIYRISADGEKVERVHKDTSANAKENYCSWNDDNSFYLFQDRFGYSYERKVQLIDITSKAVLMKDTAYRMNNCEGLFQDDEGKTWRMNQDHIYRTDDSATTYLSHYTDVNKRVFTFFGKGNMMLADREKGYVLIWNNKVKKWLAFNIPLEAEITAITVDNKDRIFFASNYVYQEVGCSSATYLKQSKLYYLRYNGKSFEPVEIENKINPRVISLAPHPSGGVWVGTCGSGLHYLKY